MSKYLSSRLAVGINWRRTCDVSITASSAISRGGKKLETRKRRRNSPDVKYENGRGALIYNKSEFEFIFLNDRSRTSSRRLIGFMEIFAGFVICPGWEFFPWVGQNRALGLALLHAIIINFLGDLPK